MTKLLFGLMADRFGRPHLQISRAETTIEAGLTLTIVALEAEERLTQRLGTKVRIQEGREKGKGRLEISYFSADDLERLMDLLTGADGTAKEDRRAALRAVSTQNFTV